MMRFTIEESNLISMYPHDTRREVLEALHQAVLYIKEPEMEALVHQVIEKIVPMTDEEFAQEVFTLEDE